MPSIVRSSFERHLWTQAQTNAGWATTKFWSYRIAAEFKDRNKWVIASHQPPTDDPGDRINIDLVVDEWTGTLMHRLFIFQGKNNNASQRELDALKRQAHEACHKHLRHTESEQLYAMTVVGTRARLWVAHRDEDSLIPWIPDGIDAGDISNYIEVFSSGECYIVDGFAYVKKNQHMSRHLLDKLRKKLYTAVESDQHSAKKNTDNFGSGSIYDSGTTSTYISTAQDSPHDTLSTGYSTSQAPTTSSNIAQDVED